MSSANTVVFRPAALPPLSRMVLAVATLVVTWEIRNRSRKGLGQLDARLLHDIGVDALTAQDQAQRPFWRA